MVPKFANDSTTLQKPKLATAYYYWRYKVEIWDGPGGASQELHLALFPERGKMAMSSR